MSDTGPPAADAAGATPAAAEVAPAGAASGEQPAPVKSASTVLVELALRTYTFGVSGDGEAYAIPRSGPPVVSMLRGGKASLRAQLARGYFTACGKAPPQQALADALLVLQGMAEDSHPGSLYQRVARHGGALWLDLGDRTGRAVRITGAGWAVVNAPPVLFRRTPLTGELPEPARGATLDELWSWLNVTDPDRPLLAAWLVAALYDHLPHPILGLFGEQGTGKTTAAKVLVSVLDPSPVPTRKPPKDAESWIVAASGSWIVGLDNLSTVPDWLSDSLCRVVTGEGDVRRKLYTDGEYAVFAYRRCVIVNGIDLGTLNGDLADRLLPINLDTITEETRRDEQDLWPQWVTAHPRILGAVLDLAAQVAHVLPAITLPRRPRMADFAKILAAVDKVLGTTGLDRYLTTQRSLAGDALTSDPFAVAIAEKLAGGTWTGTSRELLTYVTPNDDTWRRPKDWPGNARAVTTRLHRQAPVMRKAGWHVTDDNGANHDKAVRWTITPPARETGELDPRDPQTRTDTDDQHKHSDDGAGQPAGQAPRAGASSPHTPATSRADPHPATDVSAAQSTARGSAGHAGQRSGSSPATHCRVCGKALDPVLTRHQAATHPGCTPDTRP